jgi:hypothetical protein
VQYCTGCSHRTTPDDIGEIGATVPDHADVMGRTRFDRT